MRHSEPKCAVCGCTQDNACDGGCEWVGVDLCSACQAAANAAAKLIGQFRRDPRRSARAQRLIAAKAFRRLQDEITAGFDMGAL